jgi:putative ABC transport system ATP-binding protein
MINLKNIYVVFSPDTPLEKIALNKLTLNIKKGEFITVIGSNGAGKSTLLNTIAGVYEADDGEVIIDKKDMNNSEVHTRTNLVSRVFQDPLAGTCEDLTIEENLSLAYSRGTKRTLKTAISKNNRSFFINRLKVLQLGLETRLEDKVSLLSCGQRQALSLLMSTLKPMKIFLLDEHTAALDPKTGAFVLDLTKKIIEEKKLTTLMVTHSMRQALDYGTRIIMLHKGEIIFDISKEEKKNLDVHKLLDMFANIDKDLVQDELLLS